jgi:hypothetical protein
MAASNIRVTSGAPSRFFFDVEGEKPYSALELAEAIVDLIESCHVSVERRYRALRLARELLDDGLHLPLRRDDPVPEPPPRSDASLETNSVVRDGGF